ncbi:DUF4435 domain-containing protein [Bosea sp. LjRoot9]|uniref:hypothetical protein n=1 Tax=Bosea sp. LjRoot9 TaxID=3342341 RepID=UPI003ECD20EC
MSIFSETDGKSLAAELEMMRLTTSKTFVVLEGKNDKKIFVNFLDNIGVDIFVANGREFAEIATRNAKSRGVIGILCIVDRDFSDFLGSIVPDADIIVNSDHDIEISMVKSAAFDKVLREFGSVEKIKNHTDAGRNPRDIILTCAGTWGIMRLYSLANELNWKFEDIRYQSVDRDLATDDRAALIEVLNHSKLPHRDVDDALRFVTETRAMGADRWMLCCGHDYTTIFGRALRSLLGTNNALLVTQEAIEKALRLAFGAEEFNETSLYAEIRQWERRNSPRSVLRAGV